jgi:hypothetical protein
MRSFRSHNDPTRLRGVESGYIFWPCSPELARAASNEVGDLAVSSAAPSIAMRVNCYCNLVHRSPTSTLGEATRLATYTPRSILLVPPCFELLVASLRALQPH